MQGTAWSGALFQLSGFRYALGQNRNPGLFLVTNNAPYASEPNPVERSFQELHRILERRVQVTLEVTLQKWQTDPACVHRGH